MIKPLVLAIALVASPVAFAQHADQYGTSQTMRAQQVRVGTVLMVREVTVQNDKALNSGTAIGTAIGYGLASNSSSNRSTKRAVGGVVGAVVGTGIAKQMSNRTAYEIYVRDEERNRTYAIVQQMDRLPQPGNMVFLTGSGSRVRVVGVQ